MRVEQGNMMLFGALAGAAAGSDAPFEVIGICSRREGRAR